MLVLAASGALAWLFATNATGQQPANESAQPSPPSNGAISGKVVDSSGQPLTSAIAYATAIGGRVPPHGAVMDADGAFKVEGLEAGVYSIWASAPGYITEAPFAAPDAPRKYYRPCDSVTISLVKGGVIT